ncbi:MAG: AzlC family ABC transporter permease [Clostridia bacterium]|nr:AzlC family ABC transporter permease [Clostridia bacterium]MBQ7122961.1 AzlC family ABC transporter permease [Clostridia bacterium]
MKSPFTKGLSHGIPIALGYFSVSFGFGIMAVKSGLTAINAIIISLTNLTSAGQAAGVGIIAAGGAFLEMAATQFVINLRYSLMGLSLSQKLDKSFSTFHRMIASFGITDEIFAVASSQNEKLVPSYMYGLISISALGWTGGTAVGAIAGSALPATLTAAMGILLYGMFIAIIVPAARSSRKDLIVICLAALFSMIFKYLLPSVSFGFSIILSSVAAAVIGALLFPINIAETEEGKK